MTTKTLSLVSTIGHHGADDPREVLAYDPDDLSHHVARDDEAKEAGRREERARIVSWLSVDETPAAARIAAAIRQGEHLR